MGRRASTPVLPASQFDKPRLTRIMHETFDRHVFLAIQIKLNNGKGHLSVSAAAEYVAADILRERGDIIAPRTLREIYERMETFRQHDAEFAKYAEDWLRMISVTGWPIIPLFRFAKIKKTRLSANFLKRKKDLDL